MSKKFWNKEKFILNLMFLSPKILVEKINITGNITNEDVIGRTNFR